MICPILMMYTLCIIQYKMWKNGLVSALNVERKKVCTS